MKNRVFRVDYHTHTALCKHAVGTPQKYFQCALDAHLDEFGVADHCPFPVNFDTFSRMNPEQWQQYVQDIADLQEKARTHEIKVRFGVECDWVENRMDEVEDFFTQTPFDYVIGSCHYVHDFAYDNPAYKSLWDVEMTDKIWLGYVQILNAMASYRHFSILGHLDLPKRFGYFPSSAAQKTVYDGFADALKTAAKNGIVMELNTSAKRKGLPDYYPSLELLKLAHQCGVGLTFGSDAHAPCDVAFELDAAQDLAREAGFTVFYSFENRQKFEHPLF